MLALALSQLACDDSPSPNILFIYADDWGWGDLGYHGHPSLQTPNLDRLAREGTDFHHFTVASPVCSPSRIAILTGHFPARYGAHHNYSMVPRNLQVGMSDWLDPEAPLLPRVLKQAGYRTAHYGKWHLTHQTVHDAPHPREYGYDDAAVFAGPGRGVFEATSMQAEFRHGAAHDDPIAASHFSAAATEHTLRFIRESGDTPFYINLWLHETHHLVAATDEDKSAYPDTPEPQRTYYAAVTRADRQVGRVLSLLEQLGKADDTIVIFSSDNGPANIPRATGERRHYSAGSTGGRRGRKRSLYLGGVGAPFIVRWPGRVPAGRIDQVSPISGVDMFPTLLAAAGTPLPDGYQPDGENVLPLWLGEQQVREKPLFWEWRGTRTRPANWPTLAMRQGPWTFLTDESGTRRELYNVVQDPAQQHNLATQQAGRVESMLAAVRAWESGLRRPAPTGTRAESYSREGRARIFLTLDTNRDDRLDFEEWTRLWNLEPDEARARRRFARLRRPRHRFASLDHDGDETLSREEFVTPGEATAEPLE